MRPADVVPRQPGSDPVPRVVEGRELMLPHTFLFEAAKEPLDHPILLRRIWGDKLLRQPIIPAGLPKPATLKDQAIVAPQDRGGRRSERPKPRQAGGLQGPFGLLGSAAQGELIADQFTIMTIDHRREMSPAIPPAGNVGDIHGPPLVAATGSTDEAPRSRTWGRGALVDQPLLLAQHPIDRFVIHGEAVLIAQQRPQPSIPEGRMLLKQPLQLGEPAGIRPSRWHPRNRPALQRCPGDLQHVTPVAFGDTRHGRPHPSDVFRSKGYGFNASRKISLSSTSSPIFCLSFLICSSRSASSSFGRVRKAFSAPDKKRSRQSSTSATVSACLRAASATDVSPFKMLTTNATRRLAVHRSMGSLDSSAISTSPRSAIGPCLEGGLNSEGSRIPSQTICVIIGIGMFTTYAQRLDSRHLVCDNSPNPSFP